jgi:MscS family membrane protein
MTHRRIYWKVGVVYSTTIDQLRIIRDGITEFITSSDDFESPENVSTFVHVDTFSDSSIDIMVYCFTKTTNWGEWLEIKEKLAFSIKEIVEDKAGTSFAFPSTSIYLEKMPEESPETFFPPHQDS